MQHPFTYLHPNIILLPGTPGASGPATTAAGTGATSAGTGAASTGTGTASATTTGRGGRRRGNRDYLRRGCGHALRPWVDHCDARRHLTFLRRWLVFRHSCALLNLPDVHGSDSRNSLFRHLDVHRHVWWHDDQDHLRLGWTPHCPGGQGL